jgi:uncharacterized membrane protein YccF (DUF307 family)
MGALLRAVWFVFIGWWLGAIWFLLSLTVMLSIVGFPIGAYAITKTWHVMTLKTSPTVVVKEARARGE